MVAAGKYASDWEKTGAPPGPENVTKWESLVELRRSAVFKQPISPSEIAVLSVEVIQPVGRSATPRLTVRRSSGSAGAEMVAESFVEDAKLVATSGWPFDVHPATTATPHNANASFAGIFRTPEEYR